MKTLPVIAGLLACACLHASAAAGDGQKTLSRTQTALPLEKRFFYRLDLTGSGAQSEALLRRDPANAAALFTRMEIAELEDRPESVLDSALRLCRTGAPLDFQDVASDRVLEHAGNTRAFNTFVRRVQAAARNGTCAFNLRLALVAAAADGAPALDLDRAASEAGLLTRWSIAGPFGRYSNVDLERRWPPEPDQLSLPAYGSATTEDFRFRDGRITLPDYLAKPGVFYAAAETSITRGPARLEVLAAGPYVVFIDGRPVLAHDSPYLAVASRDSVLLELQPGQHRIMLKFTAEATPLRLALQPGPAMPSSSSYDKAVARQPLHEYARALASYFHEDFADVERRLDSASCRQAAACVYLRALLESAADRRSSRAAALWGSLAKSEPEALLARLYVHEAAARPGQVANNDEQEQAIILARQHPQSERAALLALDLFRNNLAEGGKLLSRLLELHPSCAHLAQAVEFYNLSGDLGRAQLAERQMDGCAPGSLEYARALSETGRHGEAAAVLTAVVAANPLDRAARRLLVEQLVLNGQPDAAREQATQLHEIAPNAAGFLRLAQDPAVVLDGNDPRAEGFAHEREFYVPYRRDALALIRDSSQRKLAGGSAAVLLADQVVRFRGDGSISVYVHRIRRLLNKNGISSYGEVSIPQGANILELRTVKSSGQIVEPEFEFDAGSVAMPALDPGDCVEEEFVSHYSGWDQMPQDASRFEFGSFVAPVLSSRLVLITPAGAAISVSTQNGAPAPHVEQVEANLVQVWERDNIAPTAAESFLPESGVLPAVTIARTEERRDRLRDQLIRSTRLDPSAIGAAKSLRLPPVAGERAKAKSLYFFVKQTIESDGADWTNRSANDTLLNSRGSRTVALLALARINGLRADLVLAREIEHACGKDMDLRCYTEPLVRFWIGHEAVDVDAESDDLPFGVVPPSLAPSDALLLPLATRDENESETVRLATNQSLEKTVADGDLWLNDRGDLTARVHVRMGATRAQELASRLRGDSRQPQAFFEQFARRMFPDSIDVTGSVLHENDPEQPLELTLRFVVPQFVQLENGAAAIGQLAPALGLRGAYARTATRRFPLYTETLYFESTVFRLHLPPGVDVRSLPADLSRRSVFGDYLVRFTRAAQQIEIRREFRIPVQLIAPDKYPAFDAFAREIDDAERQQISLAKAREGPPTSSPSKLPALAHK